MTIDHVVVVCRPSEVSVGRCCWSIYSLIIKTSIKFVHFIILCCLCVRAWVRNDGSQVGGWGVVVGCV